VVSVAGSRHSSATIEGGDLFSTCYFTWANYYSTWHCRRLISLMGYSLRSLEAALAISLLDPDRQLTSAADSTKDDDEQEQEQEQADGTLKQKRRAGEDSGSDTIEMGAPLKAAELLNVHLSLHDMRRLELYSRNMVDHHMILDTVPVLASLVFQGRLPSIRLSYLQVSFH
jgi:tRNA(Met) C34 N-acetyltransferase TmcA